MSDSTTVTSRGWWDLADADQFYPDDLPQDWRLSYFANSFRAAMLPAELWARADPQTVTRWRDDVPAGFRFVAERPAMLPPSSAQRLTPAIVTQLLGPTLGGWLEPIADTPTSAPASNVDRYLRYERAHEFPTEQRSTAALPAYGLFAAGELLSDFRRAKDRLSRATELQGRAPSLIILARPSSSQLTGWQELVELLGLA